MIYAGTYGSAAYGGITEVVATVTVRVRGGKTEKVAADFDWDAASAAFGDPRRKAVLPADAQDIVSFMYQLGLAPLTPGRIALPVTNG